MDKQTRGLDKVARRAGMSGIALLESNSVGCGCELARRAGICGIALLESNSIGCWGQVQPEGSPTFSNFLDSFSIIAPDPRIQFK